LESPKGIDKALLL